MQFDFSIDIQHGDALQFEADVFMAKYSPRAGGIYWAIRNHLRDVGSTSLEKPQPGAFYITQDVGTLPYKNILIVGTVQIFQFDYQEIRTLGRDMLGSLHDSGVEVAHAVTTVHGVNTGLSLDEEEAFRSLLLGFSDAVEEGVVPPTLKRITIVEREEYRVALLRDALQKYFPDVAMRETANAIAQVLQPNTEALQKPLADESTPHIFVAMPFSEVYDDHYYLAIRPAITANDMLSIRLDQPDSAFTGDIVEHIKNRIASAQLVVALLDGGNPNVYLEVGYAWGVATPAILILREDEQPPFDVAGARLLIYSQMYKLKEQLTDEIRTLLTR